jgi:energy-coupling factor transport system permease protein
MLNLKYQDKHTTIHHLNSLCLFLWVLNVVIFAMILNNPLYLFCLFLCTIPLVAVAKVLREWLSFMKFTFYLCIAIIIINALVSNQGAHVLFEIPLRIPILGRPVVTLEAIFFGVAMSLRLISIISAFTILNLVIHPDDLMQSMTKLKLPYKSLLVVSLCSRFIPSLIDDVDRITDVQRSRGLEMDKGPLLLKIKRRFSILIPLLSNSLDKAVQVSEAMEARAFGTGEGRTFFKELTLSRLDISMLALGFATFVFGILLFYSGYGDYSYYPQLSAIVINTAGLFLLAGLMTLLLSIVLLAFIKRRVDFD